MGTQLFLGIDFGSSLVKVGLYDYLGNEAAFAQADMSPGDPTRQQLDYHDPEVWWRVVCRATQECLGTIDPSRVAALCVGGQGPTLVAVDSQSRPVRAALAYGDGRAAEQAQRMSETLGRPISTRNSYLARVLWLQDCEPDNYAATRWFLQAWDFLVFRLTDVPASTSPLGFYAPWSEDDIARLGLEFQRFAPHFKTGQIVAGVSGTAAEQTGLLRGTPVVAGGGDFLLGTMGAAAAQCGVAQSQGGSTGAFTLCWDRPLRGASIAWCIPSPIQPGLLNMGGPLTTAGAALKWLLGIIGGGGPNQPSAVGGDYTTALDEAAKVGRGAEGLLFFPYLLGESLSLSADARGAFLGLSLGHTRAHLVRALLEGVAFAGRSILDSLLRSGGRVDQVTTYGGQARSPLWNQIKADVWNRPVRIPRVLDAGCLGAAAIATVGIGVYPTLADASKAMSQTAATYLPNPASAAIYDEIHRSYELIYASNQDIFRLLAKVRGESAVRRG